MVRLLFYSCSILFLASPEVACADLIAYWDFNGVSGTTFQSDAGQSGALFTVEPSWGSDFTVQSGAGTLMNSIPPAVAGDAIEFHRPNSHQLEGFVVSFSMADYVDPVLSFADRRTNNGFSTIEVEYSTDGVNYTHFSTLADVIGTTYSVFTLDLSSVNALDNSQEAYVRFHISDGSSNGLGHYAELDNFQVNATSTAVPEPSSLFLLSLAGCFAFACKPRRARREDPAVSSHEVNRE